MAIKSSTFLRSASKGGTIGNIAQLVEIGKETEREPMAKDFSSFLPAKRPTSSRTESMAAAAALAPQKYGTIATI